MKNPKLQERWQAFIHAKLPSIREYHKKRLMQMLQPLMVVSMLRRKPRARKRNGPVEEISLPETRKVVPRFQRDIVAFLIACRDNPEMSFGLIYKLIGFDEHKGARVRRECVNAQYLDHKTSAESEESSIAARNAGRGRGRPKEIPVITHIGDELLAQYADHELD